MPSIAHQLANILRQLRTNHPDYYLSREKDPISVGQMASGAETLKLWHRADEIVAQYEAAMNTPAPGRCTIDVMLPTETEPARVVQPQAAPADLIDVIVRYVGEVRAREANRGAGFSAIELAARMMHQGTLAAPEKDLPMRLPEGTFPLNQKAMMAFLNRAYELLGASPQNLAAGLPQNIAINDPDVQRHLRVIMDTMQLRYEAHELIGKAAAKKDDVINELRDAVVTFLEIGKRDLTNPKYDGYYQELSRLVGRTYVPPVVQAAPCISSKLEAMIKALRTIAAWDLPKQQCDGRPVSYEYNYGSNGARDYVIKLATDALEGVPAEQPPDTLPQTVDKFIAVAYAALRMKVPTDIAEDRGTHLIVILKNLRLRVEVGEWQAPKEALQDVPTDAEPTPCKLCGSLPEDLHRCQLCGKPGPGVDYVHYEPHHSIYNGVRKGAPAPAPFTSAELEALIPLVKGQSGGAHEARHRASSAGEAHECSKRADFWHEINVKLKAMRGVPAAASRQIQQLNDGDWFRFAEDLPSRWQRLRPNDKQTDYYCQSEEGSTLLCGRLLQVFPCGAPAPAAVPVPLPTQRTSSAVEMAQVHEPITGLQVKQTLEQRPPGLNTPLDVVVSGLGHATGPLTDHDWVQLEQAAAGCTSGIENWPHLKAAIQKVCQYKDPVFASAYLFGAPKPFIRGYLDPAKKAEPAPAAPITRCLTVDGRSSISGAVMVKVGGKMFTMTRDDTLIIGEDVKVVRADGEVV